MNIRPDYKIKHVCADEEYLSSRLRAKFTDVKPDSEKLIIFRDAIWKKSTSAPSKMPDALNPQDKGCSGPTHKQPSDGNNSSSNDNKPGKGEDAISADSDKESESESEESFQGTYFKAPKSGGVSTQDNDLMREYMETND